MHMITAAGRKACERVLDTATEAGARALANDNQPHRRGDRGRVHRRPAPLGTWASWTRPLHHSCNCRPCPNDRHSVGRHLTPLTSPIGRHGTARQVRPIPRMTRNSPQT